MTTRRKSKNKRQCADREYYYGRGGRFIYSPSEERLALLRMNFGAERREKLKEGFKTNELHVNRKWCIQLKHDPDLRRMLKQGVLKRTRENGGGFKTNYTVLSLA